MGVQATEKTQIQDIENKYGQNWHPVGNSMRSFWHGHGYDRMLHLNIEDKSPESVAIIAKIMLERTITPGWDESDLGTQYACLKARCDAVQFNNLPFYAHDYRPMFRNMAKRTKPYSPVNIRSIVLQANSTSLAELSPKEFATSIKRYTPMISSVLIDGSGGRGVPLDAEKVRPYIDSIYDLDVNVGIAGGLSDAALEPLAGDLLQRFPQLSVDAESGLRTHYNSEQPKRSRFSPQKASAFVEAVTQLLQEQGREQSS
jgi:hypothetical protein